jgi:C1A family cysteine protease
MSIKRNEIVIFIQLKLRIKKKKMKLLILTVFLVCTISFLECRNLNKCVDVTGWKNYKDKFDIKTITEEEDLASCEIYEKNMKLLEQKKKQRKGDFIGESSMMHVDFSTNSTDYRGLVRDPADSKQRKIIRNFEPTMKIEDIPKKFNWVDLGFNLPAKRQGNCGSCFSFSAVGAVEGQYFKCYNKAVALSEQYLIDCAPKQKGCLGGDPRKVADSISTTGIPLNSEYEYKMVNCRKTDFVLNPKPPQCVSPMQCPFIGKNENFMIDTVEYITDFNLDHLLLAIYEVGPVMIGLNADNYFKANTGELFTGENTDPLDASHAVLAVGYDEEAIIIKNSWGPNWANNGYIRVAKKSPHKEGVAG